MSRWSLRATAKPARTGLGKNCLTRHYNLGLALLIATEAPSRPIRGKFWPNGGEPHSCSRARRVALSHRGARRFLARGRARRRRPSAIGWPAVTAVIPARDEAQGVGQTVGSLLRQDYPGPFSVILVDDQSTDGTAEVARQAAARGRGSADRHVRRRAAAGLDRQTVGDEAGRRARAAKRPDLSVCSPMPTSSTRPMRSRASSPGAGGRPCAHFADGQAALRELRRARVHSGLRLLLPDALPVRLGEPPDRTTAAAAGGCMLVRSDALLRGRRHRGHPRRADRRLRAGAKSQAAGADPAQPDRARAQHPRLSDGRGRAPHGRALGLCAVALFAAAAGRRRSPAWR